MEIETNKTNAAHNKPTSEKSPKKKENTKVNGKSSPTPSKSASHNINNVVPSAGPTPMPVVSYGDPTNFQTKHPLQNRWTWWYDNPGKKTSQSSWGDHLKNIMTFDNVEDFWRLYNNIVPASQLSPGSDYHLFKEHIEPKWEDRNNATGGKWVLTLSTKGRVENLDKLWLWTVLACIGESFADTFNDDLCGCVVSVRKSQDRIAIWTRDANNEIAIMSIGRHLKNLLEHTSIIGYQAHADSQRNNSSFTNSNRFQI